MQAYIDRKTGELWDLESDGSQDNYIGPYFEPLTREQLLDILTQRNAAYTPSPEQVLQDANIKRDELLARAAIRVGPLQDAVDIGRASQDDKILLLAWKSYRVDVNEVGLQPGFPSVIEWPAEPGA